MILNLPVRHFTLSWYTASMTGAQEKSCLYHNIIQNNIPAWKVTTILLFQTLFEGTKCNDFTGTNMSVAAE